MKTHAFIILKSVILGLMLLLLPNNSVAQVQDLYSKEQFISKNDTLLYRLLLPKDFSESNKYPVLLFLHGSGERGNDNNKQLSHGSKLFADNQNAFPAIVILPQCPETDYWSNVIIDRSTQPLFLQFPKDAAPTKALTLVMELMEEMLSKSFVNKNQVYVGGLSMGGMGTFEILYRKPNMFAAAISICGAGNPETTEIYAKTTPMWIFHGANDNVVDPQHSVDMVSGILKYGGKPNFSLYAKDNHNSWDSAFAEPELLPWLFSNSKLKQ